MAGAGRGPRTEAEIAPARRRSPRAGREARHADTGARLGEGRLTRDRPRRQPRRAQAAERLLRSPSTRQRSPSACRRGARCRRSAKPAFRSSRTRASRAAFSQSVSAGSDAASSDRTGTGELDEPPCARWSPGPHYPPEQWRYVVRVSAIEAPARRATRGDARITRHGEVLARDRAAAKDPEERRERRGVVVLRGGRLAQLESMVGVADSSAIRCSTTESIAAPTTPGAGGSAPSRRALPAGAAPRSRRGRRDPARVTLIAAGGAWQRYGSSPASVMKAHGERGSCRRLRSPRAPGSPRASSVLGRDYPRRPRRSQRCTERSHVEPGLQFATRQDRHVLLSRAVEDLEPRYSARAGRGTATGCSPAAQRRRPAPAPRRAGPGAARASPGRRRARDPRRTTMNWRPISAASANLPRLESRAIRS